MPDSTLQTDLRTLQSKLVNEIQGDEKAIELAQNRVNKNRELLKAINASLDAFVAEVTGGTSFADTVRTVFKAMGKPRFTTDELDEAFTRHLPTIPLEKERIRNTLWNMAKRGELRNVRKGTNQYPAEYEIMPAIQEVRVTRHGIEPVVRNRNGDLEFIAVVGQSPKRISEGKA